MRIALGSPRLLAGALLLAALAAPGCRDRREAPPGPAPAASTPTAPGAAVRPRPPRRPPPPPAKAEPAAPVQAHCLSLEACRRGCETQVADACYRLAGLYLRGHGVAQDYARQRELEARACGLGLATACPLRQRVTDPETPGTRRRVALLEAGCRKGWAESCTGLGYTLGFPLLQVPPRSLSAEQVTVMRRSMAAIEKGCELGDPHGCARRFNAIDRAFSAHAADPAYNAKIGTRLGALAARACAKGDGRWCARIAERPLETPSALGKEHYLVKAVTHLGAECRAGWVESCDQAVAALFDLPETPARRKLGQELRALGRRFGRPPGASGPLPCTTLTERYQGLLKGAEAGRCAKDADCVLYPAGIARNCGGATDRATAKALAPLERAFREQRCRYAVRCAPRRVGTPACLQGRCFEQRGGPGRHGLRRP